MNSVNIVNVPDISSGDAFVDVHDIGGRAVRWHGFTGLPQNLVERLVRRPRLSRYRGAWSAVTAARSADALISHLPRMTAAVEDVKMVRKVACPHLAFSFNFTDLPVGKDLARMRRAFAAVDQFCVYSDFEAQTYPTLFGIDPRRFVKTFWAQDAPAVDLGMDVGFEDFVAAIGGEGRDYAGMLEAARRDPSVNWVVVARPNRIFDNAPRNVAVFFNLPPALTWGIAKRAAAVVIPLRDERTCCGHITIVSAQLLGVPIISTRSMATTEYTVSIPGSTVVEPRSPTALAEAAASAIANALGNRRLSEGYAPVAAKRHDRANWAEYVRQFIASHVE